MKKKITINKDNKLDKVWDLNASEITVLTRKGFDFSGVTIIQTRGSMKSNKICRDTIAATGATDFTVIFDADAVRF